MFMSAFPCERGWHDDGSAGNMAPNENSEEELLSEDAESVVAGGDGKALAFNAFLSYSHGEHVQLAAEVQRALHGIARPWYRLRAVRVFRDRSSMAPSESLWKSIEEALSQSEYFLLLASPRAALSPWVEREVEWWLRHRGTRNLILVVGAGQVVWDAAGRDFDRGASTAVPASLFGRFASEPLWVDISFAAAARGRELRSRLQAELLVVAARLHHKPPDVLGGEDQRRRRTAYLAAGTVGFVALAALGAGLFSAREAALREELALGESRLQRELATKERLDRVANVAAQAAANGGVSPLAVAQLAYAALAATGDDAARHRQVLAHWLQYLPPMSEVLERRSPANWGEQAYLLHQGQVVPVEGGRKAWMAMSADGQMLYSADEATGKFAIHRPDTGRSVVSVDIGELTIDSDSLAAYELAGGRVLMLRGGTQSSSAGGIEPRLLFVRTDSGEFHWVHPSGFHPVVANAGCRRIEAIESGDNAQGELEQQLATVTVAADGGLRIERRVLPEGAPERSRDHSHPDGAEAVCDMLKRTPSTAPLDFPAKRPESALWQALDIPDLQAIDPKATAAGFGAERNALSMKDGSRLLLPSEVDEAISRLQADVETIERRGEAAMEAELAAASAAGRDVTTTPPEVLLSLYAQALLDDLEGGRENGRVFAIDAPAGPVLWTWMVAGAQFGEHLYCRLPRPSGEVRCATYNFHGNFGETVISPDRRYVAVFDMAYMGHDSVALIDLEAMRTLALPDPPQGTVVAARFHPQQKLLATLAASGDLHVYGLDPKPTLLLRAAADVKPMSIAEALERPAPCFRLAGDRLVYCNAGGGLTAISLASAEILWTTPRLLKKDQAATLLWQEDAAVGLLGTKDGLLLFRAHDGVVLSDWVSQGALQPRARALQDVALGADGAVLAQLNKRWYRRRPPLSPAALTAALANLPCLTGFEAGLAVKRAASVRCAAPPAR